MFLSSEDDIEELFRRAAANYPLNTESANWEALEKKLPEKKAPAYKSSSSWRHNRTGYLLILLLIPAAWICNKFSSVNPGEADGVQSSKPALMTPDGYKAEAQTAPTSDKANLSNAGTRQTVPLQYLAPGKQDAGSDKAASEKAIQVIILKSHSVQTTSKKGLTPSIGAGTPIAATAGTGNESKINNDIAGSEQNTPDKKPVENEQKEEGQKDSLAVGSPEIKEAAAKKKEPLRLKFQRFLYGGIVAAPDVTTVKFQSVKNAGFSAGLLLGYQLSKELSVETGLYYDKKSYFSEGKYFKSPYNTTDRKFTEVTGECKMLEVPVNVRYNFTANHKSVWFITTGMSAYFMKDEKYDYKYISWGQEYAAFYNNKTSSTFLFSALNLSAGYSLHIAGGASLRIEPYFKIPLKGIGTGRLPITSSGIYVGLNKRIW